jgi:hypothetical protein
MGKPLLENFSDDVMQGLPRQERWRPHLLSALDDGSINKLQQPLVSLFFFFCPLQWALANAAAAVVATTHQHHQAPRFALQLELGRPRVLGWPTALLPSVHSSSHFFLPPRHY